jgi:hypothetical protein
LINPLGLIKQYQKRVPSTIGDAAVAVYGTVRLTI